MSRASSTPSRHAPERTAPCTFGSGLKVVIVVSVLIVAGCGGAVQLVSDEAAAWGQYTQVQSGDLGPGVNQLPAPLRQGYCYRVIIAADGSTPPQLAFQSEMDRDTAGFQIQQIQARTNTQGGSLAIFGFCSQNSGTVQLRANLPGAGHGALLEASFTSLHPSIGPDVAAAAQWLVQQRQVQVQRQAERQREEIQERMTQFALEVSVDVRAQLDTIVRNRGRYTDNIIDEVRAGTQLQEALILEPDRCYLFVAVGYQTTEIRSNVLFTRIRNATERIDDGGGITYSVCTAPSGPVQEVNFTVEARVQPNAPHPPVFGVRVINRRPSSTERRAADLEWLRNDPEARLE